jgi:hypothetical protein
VLTCCLTCVENEARLLAYFRLIVHPALVASKSESARL